MAEGNNNTGSVDVDEARREIERRTQRAQDALVRQTSIFWWILGTLIVGVLVFLIFGTIALSRSTWLSKEEKESIKVMETVLVNGDQLARDSMKQRDETDAKYHKESMAMWSQVLASTQATERNTHEIKERTPKILTKKDREEADLQIKSLQAEIAEAEGRLERSTRVLRYKKEIFELSRKKLLDEGLTEAEVQDVIKKPEDASLVSEIEKDTKLIEDKKSEISKILELFENQPQGGLFGGANASQVDDLKSQFAILEESVTAQKQRIDGVETRVDSNEVQMSNLGTALGQVRVRTDKLEEGLAKTNVEVKGLKEQHAELKAQFKNQMSNADPASLRSGMAFQAPDCPPTYPDAWPYQQERWITVFGKKMVDGKVPVEYDGIVPYRTEEDLYWIPELREWRSSKDSNFSTVVQAYRLVMQD